VCFVADVLVLGAGVIGCAVAEELTRRGATVDVVDPRGVGLGASQASAGMLSPYTEGRHDPLLQELGARSLARYDAIVARLRAGGHDVRYSRGGSIEIALDEAAADLLAQESAALTRDGIAHTLSDAGQSRARAPGLAPAIATLEIPAHCAVNVPELVEAMWLSAERRGARLTLPRAGANAPGHGTVRVETTEGPLDAPHVVFAAGCWGGQIDLAGAPPLPVRPVRGQLVSLRLPAVPVSQALWGPGCYLVPWDDGTLLVGATVEEAGFEEHATVSGVASLLDAATRVLPAAALATFAGVRVGLRPGTPDSRPIIGRSERIDGLVYATGHYRNGALLAPITAELVADLVEGRALDAALAPYAASRFGEY
jgi:glycine oxidase